MKFEFSLKSLFKKHISEFNFITGKTLKSQFEGVPMGFKRMQFGYICWRVTLNGFESMKFNSLEKLIKKNLTQN